VPVRSEQRLTGSLDANGNSPGRFLPAAWGVCIWALAVGVLLSGNLSRAEATADGVFDWSADWDGFGGFSAIVVTDGGAGFVALSDRALLVTGQFTRDAGRITGVTLTDRAPLLDQAGNAMSRRRGDSEGLALAPDGTLFISFEGVPRIRQQSGLYGYPALLPGHEDFGRMTANEALEALAIAPDGALFAIPEQTLTGEGPFPVYRFRNGTWSIPLFIPRAGPFLVSGADIGPDGRLYVLERMFAGFGFRSRVRRFALDGSGEVTVLETGTGDLGNMEGISVWQDGGGLRMTLISDDNFSFLLQTQIAEFRLD